MPSAAQPNARSSDLRRLGELLPTIAEPPATDGDWQRREHVDFWRAVSKLGASLRAAGVGDEHIGGRLHEFPVEVRYPSPGVRIHGPVGVGKTRLGVGFLRWGHLAGGRIRAVLAGDMLSEIRETFRDDSPRSERAVVDEFCAVECLLIDDLGREGGFRARQSTDYVLAVLHRILSRRNSDRSKRTVITTNLTLDEIEEQYDESVASRISTLSEIRLVGDDRRRTR